jgi:acyl-CoA synthetase (NDP forming)
MTAGPTVAADRQTSRSLDFLFRPRGIAVAGAFGDQSEPARQVLANLLEAGFPGHLYGLSPEGGAVSGVPVYAELEEIPGPVEMLVLTGLAQAAPAMAEAIRRRASGRRDLRAVVVIGGGYADAQTAGGRLLQEALTAVCLETGVRLVGPNCVGIIDNKNRLDTTFLSGVHRRPGGIAVLSQSGAMGAWLAQACADQPLPVGLNKLITLGDMADVDMAEVIEHLGRDGTTRVIGLCLEGHPRARTVAEAAGRVARRKPVVVLRAGRTVAGADAIRARTGVQPGPDTLYDDAFHEHGLIRLRRLDDFVAALNALDKLPLPLGGRVALLTNAGGPGIYTLDCLGEQGLIPARLSASTHAMLTAALPRAAAIGHPDGYADMTGTVAPRQVAQSVAAALRDPGVDAVVQVFVPSRLTTADEVARELLVLLPGIKRHSLDKPFFPVLLAGQDVSPARRLLEENGVPTFATPDQAAAALGAMVRYSTDRQPPAHEAAVGV